MASTILSSDYHHTDTTIEVDDSGVLPFAPNMVTITNGRGNRISISYSKVTGNTLSGLSIYEGELNAPYPAGCVVARSYWDYPTTHILSKRVVELEEGGGGSGTRPIHVTDVRNGDSFPVARLDGTTLIAGDWVGVKQNAVLPFTIDTITFTSYKDTASWSGVGWLLNANAYQNTAETPVQNKVIESLSGTATYQNTINAENKSAILNRIPYDAVSIRKDFTFGTDTNGDYISRTDSGVTTKLYLVESTDNKIDGTNFRDQALTDAGKAWGIDVNGKTVLINADATNKVDKSIPTDPFSMGRDTFGLFYKYEA